MFVRSQNYPSTVRRCIAEIERTLGRDNLGCLAQDVLDATTSRQEILLDVIERLPASDRADLDRRVLFRSPGFAELKRGLDLYATYIRCARHGEQSIALSNLRNACAQLDTAFLVLRNIQPPDGSELAPVPQDRAAPGPATAPVEVTTVGALLDAAPVVQAETAAAMRAIWFRDLRNSTGSPWRDYATVRWPLPPENIEFYENGVDGDGFDLWGFNEDGESRAGLHAGDYVYGYNVAGEDPWGQGRVWVGVASRSERLELWPWLAPAQEDSHGWPIPEPSRSYVRGTGLDNSGCDAWGFNEAGEAMVRPGGHVLGTEDFDEFGYHDESVDAWGRSPEDNGESHLYEDAPPEDDEDDYEEEDEGDYEDEDEWEEAE